MKDSCAICISGCASRCKPRLKCSQSPRNDRVAYVASARGSCWRRCCCCRPVRKRIPDQPATGVQRDQASIGVAQLPAQARDTLRAIKQGGPFAYPRDGVVFKNFEHVLPERRRGYYHEYTVKTPGRHNRGARRIISGADRRILSTPPIITKHSNEFGSSHGRIGAATGKSGSRGQLYAGLQRGRIAQRGSMKPALRCSMPI